MFERMATRANLQEKPSQQASRDPWPVLGSGRRFILYRPGQEPLEAPSVPIVYQLLKSSG
jgi:hypothetical protein